MLYHNASHYHNNYDTKQRFISYWHQIHEILERDPQKVLEIGIGNGFVSRYLKEQGVTLTTCDSDQKLKPDFVASITKLPFAGNAFDVVSAFEVLEHLPYREALAALGELKRVSSMWVILSIPDATRTLRIEFPIPKWGKFKKLFIVPKLHPLVHKSPDENGHHWEIGKKDYPLSRILSDIKNAGFRIEKTYRVFEFPYHRFFVLRKIL